MGAALPFLLPPKRRLFFGYQFLSQSLYYRLEKGDPMDTPKPIYTAIFLTEEAKEALLKAFPPLHPKIFGHHVTLAFHKTKPEMAKVFDPYLEQVVEFEVVGTASDDKGQAVKVTVPDPYPGLNPDQLHHVTVSCVSSPVYSNELLKRGWQEIIPFKLKGVVRHFTK